MAAIAPMSGDDKRITQETQSASPKAKYKPALTFIGANASRRKTKHHGTIIATTGTAQQRSLEGAGPTTLLRGTMLLCMRMACAPFPGHSIVGVIFCHVFYLLALIARCIIGTPEPGASVDLEIPNIGHLSLGQYFGLVLSFAQALLIGAYCSTEAFDENPWGSLGVFLSFLGLVWIVLRNVPAVATDVAELGSSKAASATSFTLVLEVLACVGPDLMLFTTDAKEVFGRANDLALPVLLLLVIGAMLLSSVFIIYANQSGSSFGLDVSNEQDEWVLKRVLRNVFGLAFLALLFALGIIGLVAPFVSVSLDGTTLKTDVKDPTATAQKVGSMVIIILSDILLALMQTCILPSCRWGFCGTSSGRVVNIDSGSP